MKRLTALFFVWVMVFVPSLSFASIYRVNNQTGTSDGSNGVYLNPQDAVNAAFVGDTVLIEGTSDDYWSTINISKRLVVMGPGYFLDENPSTNNWPAMVRGINLNRGSSGNANSGAAGSIIQGLDMAYSNNYGSIDVSVSNVVIRKNRLSEVEFYWSNSSPSWNPTNVVVSQNFFETSSSSHIRVWSSSGKLNGVVFRNNVFSTSVTVPDYSFAHFFNNIFLDQQININNLLGTIRNNVFFSTNPTYNITADSITHNITMGQGFGSTFSNIPNASPGNVFVLNPAVNGSDGQYRLKINSIAEGAGFNGADIGPYGGISPYVRYGYGEMPVVWAMSTSGSVDPGEDLQVSLKAVSEN